MEQNAGTTGAAPSAVKRPQIDELGAIPNLSDKLDIEKLCVEAHSWAAVARRLIETKLFHRINGNAIARIMLLVWLEQQQQPQPPPAAASSLDILKGRRRDARS